MENGDRIKLIILISLCREKLHELEFVNPIADIIKSEGTGFEIINYKDISLENIEKADKIIICGTSLADFEYLKDIKKFSWIESCEKPILGICAGVQIIALVFNSKLKEMQEIGMIKAKFDEDFFGISREIEAYSLHNLGFGKLGKELKPFAFSEKGIQAFKHESKDIYGTLFHPEVKNKEIIKSFIKIK